MPLSTPVLSQTVTRALHGMGQVSWLGAVADQPETDRETQKVFRAGTTVTGYLPEKTRLRCEYKQPFLNSFAEFPNTTKTCEYGC